jgi:hypothetical protein
MRFQCTFGKIVFFFFKNLFARVFRVGIRDQNLVINLWKWGLWNSVERSSVSDPHPFYADPDPT